MKDLRFWQRSIAIVAALFLVAGGAVAQTSTGNVYGTVVSEDGDPLPGVTVTIEGQGAPKTQITGADGQYRFLSLDVGSWQVTAELEGYGKIVWPSIEVRANRTATLPLTLSQAVEETITVTSETPLLDERKLASGTSVTQVELEKIPTARDPWAILSQTPGVLVDRVNVGGNESGQQSVFRAQGVSFGQNDFMVDGVSITDMRATGASPTYYDFDQFAEMSFTTGGNDVTKNGSGVQVNLVTKRGTNEFRGSARFYNTKAVGYFGGALEQSQPNVEGDLHPNQCFGDGCSGAQYTGSRINEISDLGFEAGGAAVRDKLWFWGSWGKNDIKQFAASGDADDTILENTSVKINGQATTSNSFSGSWNDGNKVKAGRGAGPSRAPETLWDQRGPSAIYKFEDTHVFSSNFFLTGTYSLGDFGFQLKARGPAGIDSVSDPAAPDPLFDGDGVWKQNFLSGFASAPNDELKLDGSYFFNTGSASHELKIGGRFRNYESFSDFNWGPRNVFQTFWGTTVAQRGVEGPTTMEYFSIWAQDTITVGKATINVGFRFDQQEGTNEAVSVPAAQLFPNSLPAVSITQAYSDFDWTSIVPRLGVTYALGEDRDTLIRASFAQFADQLSVGNAAWTAITGEVYGYFFGGTEAGLYDASGFDPLFPTRSPNTVDPGLDAPLTTELIIGIEHAIVPEFVVGANITSRNVTDILDARENLRTSGAGLRPSTFADYTGSGTVSGDISSNLGGGTYSGTFYTLGNGNPFSSVAGAFAGGSYLSNGDRERDYFGYSVNFTKRLANRWMARGFYSYGDAEWDVPASWLALNDNTNFRGGGRRDGDLYVTRATGSGKGERFLQSTWTANLNGMYQVAPDRPWGFNVSGSMTAREGHPLPFYHFVGGVGNVNVAGELDSRRLDDITTFDIRFEKEFALNSAVNFTFGIDVFNVTNEGTPLSVQTRANTGSAGYLQDNVSPRIYRFGVRLGWR